MLSLTDDEVIDAGCPDCESSACYGDCCGFLKDDSDRQADLAEAITVQDLIDELQKVKDKRQVVAVCVMGVESKETLITGVKSEIPDEHDDPDTIGLCWLMLPKNSFLHD